ncbi:MAG: hypothetical protein K6G65_08585 [Lachnospiraceae bacterium]|nr:hypothetical protein [Lachnospiraceae bacterium]
MKRKYFLRGFGIGIVFSAVIVMASHQLQKDETLTEAQIIEKAEALGMVKEEDRVIQSASPDAKDDDAANNEKNTEDKGEAADSNNAGQDDSASKEAGTKKDTGKKEDATPTPTPMPSISPIGTIKPIEPMDTTVPTLSPTKSPKGADASAKEKKKYTKAKIQPGMWSEQVSEYMKDIGVVDSAIKFDDFLCNHGYASDISVGTYKIPEGASYEDIAKIITRKE